MRFYDVTAGAILLRHRSRRQGSDGVASPFRGRLQDRSSSQHLGRKTSDWVTKISAKTSCARRPRRECARLYRQPSGKFNEPVQSAATPFHGTEAAHYFAGRWPITPNPHPRRGHSSVDTDTELASAAPRTSRRSRTSVVIATAFDVQRADTILVMHKGSCARWASQQLLAQRGLY